MPSNIVAVEDGAVDYMYEEDQADPVLRHQFLQYLADNVRTIAALPSPGDNVFVFQEDWQQALLTFGAEHHLLDGGLETDYARAVAMRNRIFGLPSKLYAGGSTPNSFHVMTSATVDGQRLVDGKLVSAIGIGQTGEVFAAAHGEDMIAAPAWGHQVETHIVPVGGDRVLIAVGSQREKAASKMSHHLLHGRINHKTDLVMLGGYMHYGGQYSEQVNRALDEINSIPSRLRPTIVLTPASKPIAETDDFRQTLAASARTAPTIICCNMGEFRRLLDLDQDWRQAHAHKWEGLDEKAMDLLKAADPAYQADKQHINQQALDAAYARYSKPGHGRFPVTFVVTNGKDGVRIVSPKGISETYPVAPLEGRSIVNTAGAGDAFAGGFLFGHLQGLTEAQCVLLGNIAARATITHEGPRLPNAEAALAVPPQPMLARDVQLNRSPMLSHDAALNRDYASRQNVTLTGLLALLDPSKPEERALLATLVEKQQAHVR